MKTLWSCVFFFLLFSLGIDYQVRLILHFAVTQNALTHYLLFKGIFDGLIGDLHRRDLRNKKSRKAIFSSNTSFHSVHCIYSIQLDIYNQSKI